MIAIHSVTWDGPECVITYTRTGAVRAIAEHPVLISEQMTLPVGHPSYTQIRELHDDVEALIIDVLEDYEQAEPFQLPEPYEDEEDED